MDNDKRYLQIVKELVLGAVDTTSYAVFLFGSRARPQHSRSADIDIGILGNHPAPDAIATRIKEMVEASIVPYDVDVVDFYDADPEFKTIALKNIIIWNLPNSITLA